MKKITIILIFISLTVLAGCSKKKSDTRSIHDIQQERGIPVVVKKLTPQRLTKTFFYSGTVKGNRQSEVKVAFIIDKVQKVYVKVGDYVRKNAVVLEMDTTNVLAKYNQAKARYQFFEKTLKRVEHIHQVGGVSDQKLDEVRAKYLASKADFEAAKNAIKLTAPISGIVTEVNIREGETPVPMLPLIKIARIDTVYLTVEVSAEDVKYFKKGDAATVRLSRTIHGTVQDISLSAAKMSRQFKVDILLPNPDHTLQPGMFAEASITSQLKPKALMIDQTAILYNDNEEPYVFVIQNQTARQTPVKLGYRSGDQIELTSGVTAGELVVVEGINLLYDGAKVKVVEKME